MKYRYFPNSAALAEKIILERHPKATPVFTGKWDALKKEGDQYKIACYLLWMLEELQTFKGKSVVSSLEGLTEDLIKSAQKRQSWISFVLCYLEFKWEAISNLEHRAVIRKDKDADAT